MIPTREQLLENKVRLLEEENELLREQVANFRKSFAPPLTLPLEWGFTATETSILSALAAHARPVDREALFTSYLTESRPRSADEIPELKILDVFVSKIRRKCRERNLPIEIDTVWGRGYMMKEEGRNLINSFRDVNTDGAHIDATQQRVA